MATPIKAAQARALNGGMPSDELNAESEAAGSSASESKFYSCTSRLIRLRSVPILAIRTIDLRSMVRS